MPVATAIDIEKFTEFSKPLVDSGQYGNANDVLAAAMRALTRETDDEAKRVNLLAAIEEGEASGIYEGDIFNDIRVRHGFPAKVRR